MRQFWAADCADRSVVQDAVSIHPCEEVFDAGKATGSRGVACAAHGFVAHPCAEITNADIGYVFEGWRFSCVLVEECQEMCDIGCVGAECVLADLFFMA